MDDIASRFFNSLEECPKEIKNCSDLRSEYMKSLDALKVRSGCSPCAERNLRNQFIEKIKNAIQQ